MTRLPIADVRPGMWIQHDRDHRRVTKVEHLPNGRGFETRVHAGQLTNPLSSAVYKDLEVTTTPPTCTAQWSEERQSWDVSLQAEGDVRLDLYLNDLELFDGVIDDDPWDNGLDYASVNADLLEVARTHGAEIHDDLLDGLTHLVGRVLDAARRTTSSTPIRTNEENR